MFQDIVKVVAILRYSLGQLMGITANVNCTRINAAQEALNCNGLRTNIFFI